MNPIRFLRLLSGTLSLGGLIVGFFVISLIRRLWFEMPPGIDKAKYHEWLSAHASLADLRILAITGDNAVDWLCRVSITLSVALIVIGLLNFAAVAGELFKTNSQDRPK